MNIKEEKKKVYRQKEKSYMLRVLEKDIFN